MQELLNTLFSKDVLDFNLEKNDEDLDSGMLIDINEKDIIAKHDEIKKRR